MPLLSALQPGPNLGSPISLALESLLKTHRQPALTHQPKRSQASLRSQSFNPCPRSEALEQGPPTLWTLWELWCPHTRGGAASDLHTWCGGHQAWQMADARERVELGTQRTLGMASDTAEVRGSP